jgi:uncharacterized membrane protein
MFSFINNFLTLVLLLPVIALFSYIAAALLQSLIGGPTWLWMSIIIIIGIGAAAEESKKLKAKQENQPQ